MAIMTFFFLLYHSHGFFWGWTRRFLETARAYEIIGLAMCGVGKFIYILLSLGCLYALRFD